MRQNSQEPHSAAKPRMLYITAEYEGVIVPNNMEPIVYRILNWLDYFFDVKKLTSPCSLAREIEAHQPDIILHGGFVEGCHTHLSPITDIFSHPQIPRAGLCVVDSISPTRQALFERLLSFGCQSIFVLGDTTMGQTYPELADKIFYIPQFIDPSVYRDYGCFKSIPVLMVGAFDNIQYPWRQAVGPELIKRFPTCYFRHPGYTPDGAKANPVVIYGETFAKTINSALITPTSGGFKNIAVSKHVEIPGSRSCLVSDATEGVRIFGFESMRNCVFADAKEAPEAVDYLLRDRDELARITDAGYEFVHSRHTLRQRDQLVSWMNLMKKKSSGQKIIQPDLFGPLELVEADSTRETLHLDGGEDTALIKEGQRLLWAGDLESAAKNFKKVEELCGYMSEPQLYAGIMSILGGNAEAGFKHIGHNINWVVVYGGTRSDPVDIAYALIAMLAGGRHAEVVACARQYGTRRRIELDRARWAVFAALGQEQLVFDLQLLEESEAPQLPSMHVLPKFDFAGQMEIFIRMLEANKQTVMVKNLRVFVQHELAARAQKRPALAFKTDGEPLSHRAQGIHGAAAH